MQAACGRGRWRAQPRKGSGQMRTTSAMPHRPGLSSLFSFSVTTTTAVLVSEEDREAIQETLRRPGPDGRRARLRVRQVITLWGAAAPGERLEPISTRNPTDLDAEPDRSRRRSLPIRTHSRTLREGDAS